jgi:tetratricopeptide (TPR) repeat protein
VIAAAVVAVAAAHAVAVAQAPEPKLGTISFPNSGNAAAQAPFLKGMKLYWSFEYGPAATAFKEAQAADPTMTLAYVGEALTYTHQVWNQQDMAAGRAALARLGATATQRLEKAKTPRERMYGELAEALYGEGSKAARDTSFTRLADKLATANPNDDEAKMFYAVGLLGLNQSVRENVAYMKAGAIAEEVLKRNPDHPAAAHFVIHAYDDPINAPKGLGAARAYSKIAPAAPHAQHMTTHIFVAMGMWDDVIAQNHIAAHAQTAVLQASHYTIWLGYGLMQAGRFEDARQHVELLKKNAGGAITQGLNTIMAHYYVETGKLIADEATASPGPITSLAAGNAKLAFGLAALARKDTVRAGKIVVELSTASTSVGPALMPQLAVLAGELKAAYLSATGHHGPAAVLAEAAAKAEEQMPYEFGPPQFVKPTHELLGEIYLAANNPREAKAAFEKALARTPGRSLSLIGLIRAANASGDRAAADASLAKLKSTWHAADASLTELTRTLASGAK